MEVQVNRRSLFRLAGLVPLGAATALVTPRPQPADLREKVEPLAGGHIADHEELAKRVNELLRLVR